MQQPKNPEQRLYVSKPAGKELESLSTELWMAQLLKLNRFKQY